MIGVRARPGCPARWPRAAPRSPRTTCGCCSNFARKLVLAFDADAAGQAAAERFYEWERELRDRGRGGRPARRAATRPTWPGPTPSALRGRGRGRRAVPRVPRRPGARRRPTWHTPEGRARAAEAALAVIAEHPERARPRPVRDGGRRPLPASTPDRLRAMLRRRRRPPVATPRAGAAADERPPPRAGARPSAEPELAVLRRSSTHRATVEPGSHDVLFADRPPRGGVPRAHGRDADRATRRSRRPIPSVADLLARLAVEERRRRARRRRRPARCTSAVERASSPSCDARRRGRRRPRRTATQVSGSSCSHRRELRRAGHRRPDAADAVASLARLDRAREAA